MGRQGGSKCTVLGTGLIPAAACSLSELSNPKTNPLFPAGPATGLNPNLMRSFTLFILIAAVMISRQLPAQWANVPSIPAADIFALTAGPEAWFAATDNLVFASSNGGETWTELPASPFPGGGLNALYSDGTALYAGALNGGVARSFDGGQNWQSLTAGLTAPGARSVHCFLARGDSLLLGTEGGAYFIRKSQASPPWQGFNEGLAFNLSYTINALAFTGTAFLAGAGANGHLYRRGLDDGAWAPIPIADPFVSDLTAQSFLLLPGKAYAGTQLGLFRSVDDGRNWQRVSANQGAVSQMLIFEKNDVLLSVINRLTYSELYASGNEGASWTLLGNFPANFIYGLQASGDRLYMACSAGLLWAPLDIISETTGPGQPATNHIQAVFPNPASSRATVAVHLEKGQAVRIGLFDSSGRMLQGMVSGYYPPGQHDIDIDLEGLPGGAHVLRCWFGEVQESRLLVVR